jgi:hypothetical protein
MFCPLTWPAMTVPGPVAEKTLPTADPALAIKPLLRSTNSLLLLFPSPMLISRRSNSERKFGEVSLIDNQVRLDR